jgi:acyl-CoA synthetase (NDP forming)
MTEIARASGMRIVGPNCLGLFDVRNKFYATFAGTFLDPNFGWPKPGSVGIVSQSGAFGMHTYFLVANRGLGMTTWISTGNEADVEFGECLCYLAKDPNTKVILAYLEGARNKDTLVEGLELARKAQKPVVMVKVGRSAIGATAASSHTGSLVGSDSAYDALFKQYGAYRANTIMEAIDVVAACAQGRFPDRPHVGTVSLSGGANVIMADAAAETGLELPVLPAAAQQKLAQFMPHSATRNPTDTTGGWSINPRCFGFFSDVLLTEGNLPAVIVFGSTMGVNNQIFPGVRADMKALRARYPDRLLILSTLFLPKVKADVEANDDLLVIEDPDRAMRVIAALHRFRTAWAKDTDAPEIPRTMPKLPSNQLGEVEALAILKKAGIPVVAHKVAATAAEAGKAAAALKTPVVAKIASPDILHKTEIGGVMLGLETRKAAEAAFREITRRARKAKPKAKLDGVVVMKQVEGGIETILGAHDDPALGPVVMFGLGGIFVEVFKDVSFRLAPISVAEARAMIREVKGYPILAGARGKTPADLEAIAKALSRLSLLAAANAGGFESIDVNPFIALPKGKGAVAVDAVIVPKSSGTKTAD